MTSYLNNDIYGNTEIKLRQSVEQNYNTSLTDDELWRIARERGNAVSPEYSLRLVANAAVERYIQEQKQINSYQWG